MEGTNLLIPELRHSSNSEFELFWKSFPKRHGSNSKKLALRSWKLALREVSPEEILSAVQKMKERDKDLIGTPYMPMAATWLNQARWEEFQYRPAPGLVPVQNNAQTAVYVAFGERDAWDAYGRSIGKSYPRDSRGGWWFPTRHPPTLIPNSPDGPENAPPTPSAI